MVNQDPLAQTLLEQIAEEMIKHGVVEQVGGVLTMKQLCHNLRHNFYEFVSLKTEFQQTTLKLMRDKPLVQPNDVPNSDMVAARINGLYAEFICLLSDMVDVTSRLNERYSEQLTDGDVEDAVKDAYDATHHCPWCNANIVNGKCLCDATPEA